MKCAWELEERLSSIFKMLMIVLGLRACATARCGVLWLVLKDL
jgi:hypothetical protein